MNVEVQTDDFCLFTLCFVLVCFVQILCLYIIAQILSDLFAYINLYHCFSLFCLDLFMYNKSTTHSFVLSASLYI